MAYLPGYDHDLFVSYARVDDECFHGLEKGWVTTLIDAVKVELAKKIGRKDWVSLWMDHELSPNEPITPTILGHAKRSAILLVVLSPAYLASDWCRRERESFLSVVDERARGDSSLFIVELADLRQKKPKEFADLIGYRFWDDDGTGHGRIRGYPMPDPKSREDRPYYDAVTELCTGLVGELERVKEKVEHETESATAPEPALEPDVERVSNVELKGSRLPASEGQHAPIRTPPTVFLADVADDLLESRSEVESYLQQSGLPVLPTKWYPRDPVAFERAVDDDLVKASLFVQLLGLQREAASPGYPLGRGGLQYARAVARNMPILQWRGSEVDPNLVDDEEYRSLLNGESVIAVGLEELKRTVVSKANANDAFADAAFRSPGIRLAFVDFTPEDRETGSELASILSRNGINVRLPRNDGEPSEVRRDLEDNLRYCDGLMVVFGKAPAMWVREQLRQLRRVENRRTSSLAAAAIVSAPPTDKESLQISVPGMSMIDCRHGINEYLIRDFISSLLESDTS